jgi:hypothetical protein
MARIDPKDDELGMMENIFLGVRPVESSEKSADKTGAAEVDTTGASPPGVASTSTEGPSPSSLPSSPILTPPSKPQS